MLKRSEEMAELPRIRIALAQLFLDFLRFIQLKQALKQLEMHCGSRRGHATWDCCAAHQYLKNTYKSLEERGSALCQTTQRVLSQEWWQEIGFNFPVSHAEIID